MENKFHYEKGKKALIVGDNSDEQCSSSLEKVLDYRNESLMSNACSFSSSCVGFPMYEIDESNFVFGLRTNRSETNIPSSFYYVFFPRKL